MEIEKRFSPSLFTYTAARPLPSQSINQRQNFTASIQSYSKLSMMMQRPPPQSSRQASMSYRPSISNRDNLKLQATSKTHSQLPLNFNGKSFNHFPRNNQAKNMGVRCNMMMDTLTERNTKLDAIKSTSQGIVSNPAGCQPQKSNGIFNSRFILPNVIRNRRKSKTQDTVEKPAYATDSEFVVTEVFESTEEEREQDANQITQYETQEKETAVFIVNTNQIVATIGGNATAKRKVIEGNKPLIQYLQLPPSEYSTNILQVDSIARLNDSTFKCSMEKLNVLGTIVQPVITMQVVVGETAEFRVISCEIQSSDKRVAQICGDLKVSGTTILEQTMENGQLQMSANTGISISIPFPKNMRLPFGKGIFESAGNLAIRATLKQTVRMFLKTLEKDYQAWARDDPARDTWVGN